MNGCETWSLDLKEEYSFSVFNLTLRRIFEHKREGVTEGRIIFHNVRLHNLCCTPNIDKALEVHTKFLTESLKDEIAGRL